MRKTDRGYRKRLDKELLQLYDIEKYKSYICKRLEGDTWRS